jgi:hypothetical protein
MAIHSTTLWEFRASNGAADNGGGFANLDPGTSVDYGNQISPELVITDGATSGIGVTTLTSVNGGFTAAMAGNVIYLQTGTNLIDDWYQITVFTDTNTVTLDRAPDDGVGGVSGADGNVGGALDILTDAFLDNTTLVVPGQTIYVKNDGTMTLTGAISLANDGNGTNPITLEGYNSSRGDNPVGTDRPLIACAANAFSLGDYWIIKNISGTATSNEGFRADAGSLFINCKMINSSGTANRQGFTLGNAAAIIKCEVQTTNGYGIWRAGNNGAAIACYIHDCSVAGFVGLSALYDVANCIIDTCGIGIWFPTADDGAVSFINNNTIYNCTTGLLCIDGDRMQVINNIFDNCTTGASWTTEQSSNFFDNNQWSNNGTDVSNVTKGDNALTENVTLTDPANGDFTLPSGAGAIGTGLQVGTDEGAVGDYSWNIGVDQDDVSAGGGGLIVHPGMTGGFSA